MINLKVKDAQEIASYFLFKINNFSFNPKETAEALFQFMDDSFHLLPLI